MYLARCSLQHGSVLPRAATRPGAGAPGVLRRAGRAASTLPPTSYFLVSAVFHYLGPSLAVLLFAHVDVLGVAWLRIASAAVLFACWRRPWRLVPRLSPVQRWLLLGLGAVLAAMNSLFYLAVDRLPLSTVGAIEFLGTVILAAAGARTRRNLLALVLAVGGVAALTDVRLVDEPLGFAFAFANCAGFMLYVVLGHRIANTAADGDRRDGEGRTTSGIDQLGAAMIVAAVLATPFGVGGAAPAFSHPDWLLWGIGVGLCSSVVPYVTDQLAMARLPRATFALMLALLPATATGIGLIVLGQVPTSQDLVGIGLVIAGVALHTTRDG
jgi:inner membrane transporter RhtA